MIPAVFWETPRSRSKAPQPSFSLVNALDEAERRTSLKTANFHYSSIFRLRIQRFDSDLINR